MSPQKIMKELETEENTTWLLLLKINMVAIPILATAALGWATWATTSIFEFRAFTEQGPRYTETRARADMLVLQQKIMAQIRLEFPPQWLRDDLAEIKEDLKALKSRP